jgi:hypothetical protein
MPFIRLDEIGGQSLNSELSPAFVRCSISDRQIFDATQYLFAPAKNSALCFTDRAVSHRSVNVRTFFENLIFVDVTMGDILSISARDI